MSLLTPSEIEERAMTEVISIVRAGEEQISLPIFLAHAADLNPMFIEKRVYQGSSGKVS